MRRLLLVLPALALAASSLAFARAGGGAPEAFRLADASAACRTDGGALVCRSLGVGKGLELPAAGIPRAIDAPVWWDASTPVLHAFDRDGVACRVSGGAIVCHNAAGATIAVGPRQISVGL
jgi:hypothetical protein